MTANPFKEADIIKLANSANTREHALARLKDQQCMEGLRDYNDDLKQYVYDLRRALEFLLAAKCPDDAIVWAKELLQGTAHV